MFATCVANTKMLIKILDLMIFYDGTLLVNKVARYLY